MLKPLTKQEQQKQREEAARKEKLTQFAKICQDIFGKTAQEKGKKVGIFERIRKITPEAWIQSTVEAFGCDVSGTLENITDILKNNHGIHVTQEAVSTRLHDPKTQTFFKELIAHAMHSVIETEPNLLAIAKKFHGIYAGDCTTIALPESAKDVFPGCGCQYENKGNAAMKIYFCTDLLHGTWKDMIFAPGKTSDQKLIAQSSELPTGSLDLHDMGFFNLARFEKHSERGVFWISHVPTGTTLYVNNQKFAMEDFLRGYQGDVVDIMANIGEKKLPSRFIAIRSPKKTVKQRIKRLRKEAAKENKEVSARSLELAQWTIFITNIPIEMLGCYDIMKLYTLRWQVELIFKLWKSECGVPKSHGWTGDRILCEIYAKMLSLIITNWVLITKGGPLRGVSMTKIYCKVRAKLPQVFSALASGDVDRLCEVFEEILASVDEIRSQKRRKKHPTARQTLENIKPNTLT